MGKGVRVGLDKLHYAIMTDETTETYATPKQIPGAITANVSPEVNSATLYADDQAAEVATALGAIEVEINVKDLTAATLRDILGSTVDANGVAIDNKNDNAPYLAIGFRSRKSNGAFRYFWLYKGKFTPSEEEYNTKEDSPSFQTPTITGTFLPRDSDGDWRARVDSDDVGVPSAVTTNWFNSVYKAGSDTTPLTVTIVPANNATAVVVTTKVVWTFNKAVALATLTSANFFVQKADGTAIVAGTFALDVTGKIVTFTPSANLTASTAYMAIANVGITDIAGNALAAPSVNKFTTA